MNLLRSAPIQPETAEPVTWPNRAENCSPDSEIGRRVRDREKAADSLAAETVLMRQIRERISRYEATLRSDDWAADHLEAAKAMAGLPICQRALGPVAFRQDAADQTHRAIADNVGALWQRYQILRRQLDNPPRDRTAAGIREDLIRLGGPIPEP